MAPHWKCGLGQPIAGSNPALSATRFAALIATDRVATAPRSRGRARALLSFPSRARRGTSGALYLQSAPAGLNPLPRSPLPNAARRRDVEDRVPRSGEPRTVSDPEGSSTKRSSSGAAERPGPSRPSWWARGRPARRRVHGTSTRLRTDGGDGDGRDPAPGAVPTLAGPDLRPDRRPGRGRPDAAQRRPCGPGQPRRPVRRAARHRQDVPRPHPRQGPQLHGPPGRRRLRSSATRASSIREGTTLDLIEIDAASNRGIEAVRELRERLPYPPGPAAPQGLHPR